jgi:hypothetical protein
MFNSHPPPLAVTVSHKFVTRVDFLRFENVNVQLYSYIATIANGFLQERREKANYS